MILTAAIVVRLYRTDAPITNAADLSRDRSSSGLVFLEAATPYSLDTVDVGGTVTTVASQSRVILRLNAGQEIGMAGWAIDRQTMKPAGGVSVDVDGRKTYVGAYGSDREDVASALNNEALRSCGFKVLIPQEVLTKGWHELSLIILNAQRSGYYEVSNKVAVDVE